MLTPILSEAEAETVTVPEIVDPFDGDVIDTVGLTVSGGGLARSGFGALVATGTAATFVAGEGTGGGGGFGSGSTGTTTSSVLATRGGLVLLRLVWFVGAAGAGEGFAR